MSMQPPHTNMDGIEDENLQKEILWATHKHLLEQSATHSQQENSKLSDRIRELDGENKELRHVMETLRRENEVLRNENEAFHEKFRQIRQHLEGPVDQRKRKRQETLCEMEQGYEIEHDKASEILHGEHVAKHSTRQQQSLTGEELGERIETSNSISDSGPQSPLFETPYFPQLFGATPDATGSLKSELDSAIQTPELTYQSSSPTQTHPPPRVQNVLDPSITIRLLSDAAQSDSTEQYDNVPIPDGVKKSITALVNKVKAHAQGKVQTKGFRSSHKCAAAAFVTSKVFWVEGRERQLCCRTCFNERRACFIVTDGQAGEEFAVLPLPASVRPKDASPGDDGHYIHPSKDMVSRNMHYSPWSSERTLAKKY